MPGYATPGTTPDCFLFVYQVATLVLSHIRYPRYLTGLYTVHAKIMIMISYVV